MMTWIQESHMASVGLNLLTCQPGGVLSDYLSERC